MTCRTAGLALLGVLLASPAAAQGTFEGRADGTMSTPEGKTVQFKYYQLGGRIRQEYVIEGQTMTTIYDGATGDMIMLMPQKKQYMVMNMRQMGAAGRQMADAMSGRRRGGGDAPDFSKMKVTPTGQRETIAGISCEHYLFENTDGDHKPMDICGAPGMGFMGMDGGQATSSMPSTIAMLNSQNPELARIARQGFFPLKMTFPPSHGTTAVWQITQIDRARPASSLFAPPAGFSKFEMPNLPGMKP